jgi:hypothetical protein
MVISQASPMAQQMVGMNGHRSRNGGRHLDLQCPDHRAAMVCPGVVLIFPAIVILHATFVNKHYVAFALVPDSDLHRH